MLYLFCNRTYGAPFIHTAREWARRPDREITVVLSGRRAGNQGRMTVVAALRRRLGSLRRQWKLRRELGLPVQLQRNVNAASFSERIDGANGIVAGFDQIFKRRTIERFNSLVNFHPSLLPFYRGPVPAYWCLRNGEAATGFSLHRVVPEIDAGDVIWQQQVSIESGDDADRLTERIAIAAQPAFERYLDAVVERTAFETRRVDAAAIYRVHEDYNSFPTSG